MATVFQPAFGASLTTTYTTIYTVPAGTVATILMMHVSNTNTASSVDIDVQWLDASNASTARNLATAVSVPTKAAYDALGGQKLILGAGDVIQARRGATGTADITISVMEQS